MTIERLAKTVTELSERVDARFEQIDGRFERLERRFDEFRVEMRTERRAELEEFADRIERRVQILLEAMTDQFRFAFDRNTATAQHLDAFERANAEEPRVMQARIDDLDGEFRSRRPRRRPS